MYIGIKHNGKIKRAMKTHRVNGTKTSSAWFCNVILMITQCLVGTEFLTVSCDKDLKQRADMKNFMKAGGCGSFTTSFTRNIRDY